MTIYQSGPPDKVQWLYMTGVDTTDSANLDTAARGGWTIAGFMQRPNGWAALLVGNYTS